MKSLSTLFVLSAASVLFLISCGNKSAGQQSSTDSDSIATAAVDTVVQEQKTYEPGRGDLGVFDLRGPVKECKQNDLIISFNQEGQWTAENGKAIEKIYPGGVKRDKNGRINKGLLDKWEETYHEYHLDSKGLVTKIEYHDYLDGGNDVTYSYDADGYVASESDQGWGMDAVDEETGEEAKPVVTKYTILEKDSYGNWIKRKDQKGNITTRKITYYE
jgi:hypothetical protein